jgi:hypothetical protein
MPALYGIDDISTQGNDDIYLYRTDSIGSNLCFQQTSIISDTVLPLPLDSQLNNIIAIMGGDIQWSYAGAPIQNRGYNVIDGCIIANQPIVPEPIYAIVFPNPSKGIINIQSELNIDYVRLTDPSGRIMWNIDNLNLRELSIQFDNQRNGFYILEISIDKHLIYKKIILED